MKNTFTILFFPRKTRTTKGGEYPIYARVTINGERLVLATKQSVADGKWNTKTGAVKGQQEDALRVNSYLEAFRKQLFDHYTEMLNRGIPVTTITYKKQMLGIQDDQKTIVNVFEKHNAQIEARIGHEYARGTLVKFRSTLKHLLAYINVQYQQTDLPLGQLDHSFVTEFEFYLKNTKGCSHNSALKYVKLFRKIIRQCMAHGWMTVDPFVGYKSKVKHVERDFLTKEELETIEKKEFSIPRLQLVKDIFVFSCYTGIAYIDVSKLTKDNLVQDEHGTLWVNLFRTKTNTRSQIPLLPQALEIIRKYESYPVNNNLNRLLPTMSNQKMNAYLKEIADLCGIRKHLTFHVARHSFGTTVTLTNGVPIETVSAMLGHRSIRTTQIYARILNVKIGHDMKVLQNKLAADGKKEKDDSVDQCA